MSETPEVPFASVLDVLLNEAESLPIHLLYRLSDLAQEDLEALWERWPNASDERRRIITRHLVDISEDDYRVQFVDVFTYCLDDKSAPVRSAALDGLWDTTNIALISPIIRMLHEDEDANVQASAASALAHFILMTEWGQLPASTSDPAVQALLQKHDEPDLALVARRAIIEALGAANHPRVNSIIEDAYESIELELQLSALFAMGSSADRKWLPYLIDEMESSSPELRAEAARAAGGIGDFEAVSELANLAMDEVRDVAIAAITALGQVGGGEAARILSEMADDPEFESLHETIDEALDEMEWLDGVFDLPLPQVGVEPDDE